MTIGLIVYSLSMAKPINDMEFSGKTYHWQWSLSKISSQLWLKSWLVPYRLWGIVWYLPIRLKRFLIHLWQGGLFFFQYKAWRADQNVNPQLGILSRHWWIELLLYLLDIIGFSECYETLMDWVKWNARPLHDWEIALAKTIYGNSLDYRRIRIDESSWLGPKQNRFCYVSYYFINSWGAMPNDLLIHELIHIWQYERIGAVYMPRALRAQYTPMGYNYGGIYALKSIQKEGKSFFTFNLEQQGDIVSDYYRIREGYPPHWGQGTQTDLAVYRYFVEQVQAKAST